MPDKHILVLVDFSDATPRVLHEAIGLAAAFDAKLHLLHVVSPEPDYVGFDLGPAAVRQDVTRELEREQQELKRITDELRAAGHDACGLLAQGPVVEKVIAEARHCKCDYILLGSHGHGALYHALMGSITSGILRDAPCPVVVVPGGD